MNLQDLYSRYATDVRRFELYLCGNAGLADDLTSETFLKAWSSSAPIREATVSLPLHDRAAPVSIRIAAIVAARSADRYDAFGGADPG
jgi:hypothetical protein